MKASDIASFLGGRLLGEDRNLLRISPIGLAHEFDLSLVIWPKDIGWAKKCKAGCLISEIGIAAMIADEIPCSLIAVPDLWEAMQQLKALNTSGRLSSSKTALSSKLIASDALVDNSARLGRTKVGKSTIIGPNVVIGDDTTIGDYTVIEAGAVIYNEVTIGNYSFIGANTVIGSFGFAPYGEERVRNLPSLGDVKIFDHVRIGALCTIDRGLIGSTTVREHTLIDNMVHIGHDVVIGEHVVVAGQTGFAGFARIDSYVTVGGQVGVAPHIHIETNARISGKSMVHCDIKAHEIWSGNPSVPHAAYLREYGRTMNSYKGRQWKRKAQ